MVYGGVRTVKGVLITCVLKSMGLLVIYSLAFGLVRQTAVWNIERTQGKPLNHVLLGTDLDWAYM